MKENWIQLIDTIEKDPFETEAFVALMEYVGEASDEDKSFCFRKLSERERGRCLILFGVLGYVFLMR